MAFNINDFLNAESKKEIKTDWKPVKLSVHKLRPAKGKENFYHMDDREIEETARTIELIGLQQYPVVKPIEGTDEYEIIAGHKRRLAILKLLEEGKEEFEMIPCKVERSEDDIKNRLILIFTNSTQRERTDYEKMVEIKEVRALLEEWKKDKKLPGRTQDIIAKMLGTSKTKIGTLEHIDNKLIEPFKKEFATEKINTSTANKLAGLEEKKQEEVYKNYQETGKVVTPEKKTSKKEIQEEPEEIPGQFCIEDYPEVLPIKASEPIKEQEQKVEKKNEKELEELDEAYRSDILQKIRAEADTLYFGRYKWKVTPLEEIEESIERMEEVLQILKIWKKEREKGDI